MSYVGVDRTMKDSLICKRTTIPSRLVTACLTVNSVSTITEDSATLTTYLTAKPASWSDVASNYDLDFGQAVLYPPQRLKERSLWGDITNVGKGVLDAATGNVDLSKSIKFPVNAGLQGQRANIYTDDK